MTGEFKEGEYEFPNGDIGIVKHQRSEGTWSCVVVSDGGRRATAQRLTAFMWAQLEPPRKPHAP